MKTIVLNDNSSKSLYGFRSNVITTALQQGYKVICVCPDDGCVDDIIGLGAIVETVNLQRKGKSIFSDYQLYKRYVEIFKKYSANLVINYSIKPNIYGQFACNKLNIKSICVVTGAGYVFLNNKVTSIIARVLYKLALPKSDEVLFLNQDDKNDFINGGYVNNDKATLLNGEGVDSDKFGYCYKHQQPYIFAYVGRMLWDKGISEFVKAISQIPQAKGVLIGGVDDGNPSGINSSIIKQWVDDGKVEYWGEMSDMQTVYSNISCLVLPSYREGLSMSIMEAMSSGLPIVTTNVRGCRDLVDDGVNGLIANVKDSDDLRDKINDIILLDLEEMGLNSRKIINNKYTKSHINKFYIELFDKHIKN